MNATENPTLLDDVVSYIKRYVFLKDESLYRLIATWIIGTHLHHDFDWFGYLFIHSPEPQSGKTTLLEVIASLAYKSRFTVEPTQAVLSRTGTDATQLLDEVDSWSNGTQHLRSVLNAGFKRTGAIQRIKKREDGGYEVEDIPIYCPRVLAGIGTSILSPVTRTRTFMIPLVRQTKGERRARFRSSERESARVLATRIEGWAAQNRDVVRVCYSQASQAGFPYLAGFNDRTIDIADALAAITEVIYRDGPDALSQARAELVVAIGITRDEREVSEARQIIAGLYQLAVRNSGS